MIKGHIFQLEPSTAYMYFFCSAKVKEPPPPKKKKETKTLLKYMVSF